MRKKPTTLIRLLACWLLLGAHAVTAQSLDKSAIKAIELQIDPSSLARLGLPANDPDLQGRIIKNLAQWRFPFQTSNGQNVTHTLKVDIGEVTRDSTPVGFSFSAGNSDPRAQGFQKASVMPIECSLVSNANSGQIKSLSMSFSAMAAPVNTNKLKDSLVENISTVCFDLLDGLHFLQPPSPEAKAAEAIKTPTWMPSLQIETVTEPKVNPAVPVKALEPIEKNQAPAKAVTDEEEEGRKQIIIHNQGTPLILKFGHERR